MRLHTCAACDCEFCTCENEYYEYKGEMYCVQCLEDIVFDEGPAFKAGYDDYIASMVE